MAQYRETNNALSLEDRQNTVVASLNSVNDQYTRARTERIQKEAVYNQIETLPSAALADSSGGANSNPAVQSLRTRLADLQRRRCSSTSATARRTRRSSRTRTRSPTRPSSYQDALDAAVESIRNDYETALRARSGASPRRSKSRRAPRWI